ncbi:MAG: phosphoenolpyruvate synthase [archaeon]|nr:phosphoenolpyruvate synthase [Nanoarchaeota archaeon]
MAYVAWFKDLDENSLPVAGGKGNNLGIMFNLGLPVPGGFIVTAQTYKEFVETTQINDKIFAILKGLDVNDTEDLQKRTTKIQELIISTPVPENIAEEIKECYEVLSLDKKHATELVDSKDVFVAVRSSATAEDLPEASFAGQQATLLNVRGKEDLVKAVKECWASLFTARATYYRVKNNFPHDKVLIAVVVQRMVNSTKSGIMFTINPSTNKKDEIVIEAVYGLGEAIVSGSVNPNLYIIDKASREIKTIEVKKQDWGLFRDENGHNVKREISDADKKSQTITDREIKELARLGQKIENHYGKPQDIEWAIEGDNVMIVQARAVTTFKEESEEKCDEKEAEKGTCLPSGKEEGEILLKGETASKGIYSGKVILVKEMSELDKVQKGDVLVTRMTTPDMVPAMQKAGAIVTDEGGLTCHAAIVSREMGTPCIVGTEVATSVLKDKELVTVNATQGIVYAGKVGSDQEKETQKNLRSAQGKFAPAGEIITATQVKVIMDLPDMAERAADTGADGVGLVRLEIMIANGGIHPAEYIRQGKDGDYVKLLKDGIGKIAKAFHGKPVWIRCSDMRTDEYKNLKGAEQEPKETDPMIGWHAIRRLLDEPKILQAEFQAVKELHDEGNKNVGVMLPFVIRTDEVKKAKEIMRDIGLEPCRDVDFGVMIETPASCWIIEELCKEGINFISFGTNDLTQLTLGIDRNNSRIAKLFDEMHPAVLGELAKVIKTCKKYDVQTSICGQAGSRPEMANFLVHQGIDSISANVDAVDEIRHVVARTEKKLMLDADRAEIEEMNEKDFEEE